MLGALIALSAGAAAGAEKPVSIPQPGYDFFFFSGFAPKSLPKRKLSPAMFALSVQVRDLVEAHPPAMREFALELDRNTRIDVTGVPGCKVPLHVQDVPDPRTVCRTSIVARGHAVFDVAFPEQPPTTLDGEIIVFKAGTRRGITTLHAYTYFTEPVRGPVTFPIKIEKIDNGRYGLLATGAIPEIAGGNGSLTHLNLLIRRKGVFLARCYDGKLQAQMSAVFSDGDRWRGNSVRSCTATS